jgi:hypothetical protein
LSLVSKNYPFIQKNKLKFEGMRKWTCEHIDAAGEITGLYDKEMFFLISIYDKEMFCFLVPLSLKASKG